ncbi:uncharacterized protein EDB91DRAFT_1256510 [Suillus paluster]|uniref:uncharacterized protein n=1 Tax=Suillus paluster TaxID=48578 RepID=UPI001B86BEBE|nr:uncharacterized protein EDB91DRAFT_1256510 [Suillus paluster]KAG1721482.1 hypothetical protein EDB91DRAFT_1256510 [Suillus paluster]
MSQHISDSHNDNEALGDGDSFMKTKDWEDIEPMWQEYAQEQFGEGWSKPGLCSGINKAFIPWSAIIDREDDFVSPMYLLTGVHLKEPLKLQNSDATALLNFWHAHQQTDQHPMFQFKAWRNKDGQMLQPVMTTETTDSLSDDSDEFRPHRGIMIRRPRDSSTESEIDGRLHHAPSADSQRLFEDNTDSLGNDDPQYNHSDMHEDDARTVNHTAWGAPRPLSTWTLDCRVQQPIPKPCAVKTVRPVHDAAGVKDGRPPGWANSCK